LTERLDRAALTGRWPYRRVHAAACALALRRWLGRWAVFALVGALVASAGAGLDTAAATLAGVAAWAALPLAHGAAAGGALALLAVLGVAAVGLALLAAMRELLWPVAWREAERALPLAARETALSDLPWVALATLPWAGLQALGLGVWLVQRPGWLVGHEAAVVTAGVAALGLTVAGGVALQGLRRRGGIQGQGRRAVPSSQPRQAIEARRPRGRFVLWQALVVWPLRRGVAPRLAWHSGLTLAASAVLLGAAAWRPGWAPWWLAFQSLVVLVTVSRARVLAALELRPLLQACAHLPVAQRGWGARLDGLCAAPALLGALAVAACVALLVPGARVALLGAWWLWLAAAALLELRHPALDAQVQSARWLFLLVTAVAMASEVLP
jgi:hypothetical protein